RVGSHADSRAHLSHERRGESRWRAGSRGGDGCHGTRPMSDVTGVMPGIHPTAIVAARAELGDNVTIGPYAIVGEGCTLGDGCTLEARAVLEKNVRLGTNVTVGIGTVLGGDPQDLKFKGEETWVEIGDNTRIREYSTINRG